MTYRGPVLVLSLLALGACAYAPGQSTRYGAQLPAHALPECQPYVPQPCAPAPAVMPVFRPAPPMHPAPYHYEVETVCCDAPPPPPAPRPPVVEYVPEPLPPALVPEPAPVPEPLPPVVYEPAPPPVYVPPPMSYPEPPVYVPPPPPLRK